MFLARCDTHKLVWGGLHQQLPGQNAGRKAWGRKLTAGQRNGSSWETIGWLWAQAGAWGIDQRELARNCRKRCPMDESYYLHTERLLVSSEGGCLGERDFGHHVRR